VKKTDNPLGVVVAVVLFAVPSYVKLRFPSVTVAVAAVIEPVREGAVKI